LFSYKDTRYIIGLWPTNMNSFYLNSCFKSLSAVILRCWGWGL
jgi:hypothetical protein